MCNVRIVSFSFLLSKAKKVVRRNENAQKVEHFNVFLNFAVITLPKVIEISTWR